ncbi:MAG: glycosyltransferase [Actinomycetota bacterium]
MRPVLAPTAPAQLEPVPEPSFSVVVAAYNVAGFVAEAVASALGQTRPPREVIVCDDGSEDDLESALELFRKRIVLLRKENGGEGSAKNAGARAASGDFVAILDADDVYLPERLAALAELASARPDLDVLTTDAILEVDGEPVRRCYTTDLPFEVDDQRSAILRRNFVFGLAAVRRERFLAAGGFDESLRYATDWDLWARLILDGSRVGAVPEPLARYRLRAGSLSGRRPELIAGRVRVLEKAALHPSLSAAERGTVTESIALERRRLALAKARAALAGELPHPRRRSLAVAVGGGHSLRTRVKALASAIAPRSAGRRLASSGRETTGGIRLPGP